MAKSRSVPKRSSISAEERRYRREEDVRTLRRYAEMAGEPGRLRSAENMLRRETRQVQNVLGKPKGK